MILLMVFIVKVEPPAEGISRAEAAKALALVLKIPDLGRYGSRTGKFLFLQTKKKETGFVKIYGLSL